MPNHNTDRELWRERDGDAYADSVHVTTNGGIGINCGGQVIVRPIREWHRLARQVESLRSALVGIAQAAAMLSEGEEAE
jgi:hypothetical protein